MKFTAEINKVFGDLQQWLQEEIKKLDPDAQRDKAGNYYVLPSKATLHDALRKLEATEETCQRLNASLEYKRYYNIITKFVQDIWRMGLKQLKETAKTPNNNPFSIFLMEFAQIGGYGLHGTHITKIAERLHEFISSLHTAVVSKKAVFKTLAPGVNSKSVPVVSDGCEGLKAVLTERVRYYKDCEQGRYDKYYMDIEPELDKASIDWPLRASLNDAIFDTHHLIAETITQLELGKYVEDGEASKGWNFPEGESVPEADDLKEKVEMQQRRLAGAANELTDACDNLPQETAKVISDIYMGLHSLVQAFISKLSTLPRDEGERQKVLKALVELSACAVDYNLSIYLRLKKVDAAFGRHTKGNATTDVSYSQEEVEHYLAEYQALSTLKLLPEQKMNVESNIEFLEGQLREILERKEKARVEETKAIVASILQPGVAGERETIRKISLEELFRHIKNPRLQAIVGTVLTCRLLRSSWRWSSTLLGTLLRDQNLLPANGTRAVPVVRLLAAVPAEGVIVPSAHQPSDAPDIKDPRFDPEFWRGIEDILASAEQDQMRQKVESLLDNLDFNDTKTQRILAGSKDRILFRAVVETMKPPRGQPASDGEADGAKPQLDYSKKEQWKKWTGDLKFDCGCAIKGLYGGEVAKQAADWIAALKKNPPAAEAAYDRVHKAVPAFIVFSKKEWIAKWLTSLSNNSIQASKAYEKIYGEEQDGSERAAEGAKADEESSDDKHKAQLKALKQARNQAVAQVDNWITQLNTNREAATRTLTSALRYAREAGDGDPYIQTGLEQVLETCFPSPMAHRIDSYRRLRLRFAGYGKEKIAAARARLSDCIKEMNEKSKSVTDALAAIEDLVGDGRKKPSKIQWDGKAEHKDQGDLFVLPRPSLLNAWQMMLSAVRDGRMGIDFFSVRTPMEDEKIEDLISSQRDLESARTSLTQFLTQEGANRAIIEELKNLELNWHHQLSLYDHGVIDFETHKSVSLERVKAYLKEMDDAIKANHLVPVSCWAGAGRSRAMAIAYLMVYHDMSLFKAADCVMGKKNGARPFRKLEKEARKLLVEIYIDQLSEKNKWNQRVGSLFDASQEQKQVREAEHQAQGTLLYLCDEYIQYLEEARVKEDVRSQDNNAGNGKDAADVSDEPAVLSPRVKAVDDKLEIVRAAREKLGQDDDGIAAFASYLNGKEGTDKTTPTRREILKQHRGYLGNFFLKFVADILDRFGLRQSKSAESLNKMTECLSQSPLRSMPQR